MPNQIRSGVVTLWLLLICSSVSLIAQDKSVRPGINDNFRQQDVGQWVERFEREGREVYDQRNKIVQLCGIKPGQVVADIGAGTGLFTMLFAQAVGDQGQVLAVDIIEKFVKRITEAAKKEGKSNIKGIVCRDDDAMLAPGSVDVVYICDTYHHFEFPHRTMRSVHKALKDGGQLIVVDFEREPGSSSEWIMNHVRAGKQTVTKEIEQAGFKLAKEEKLLTENYILRFEKQ